MFNYTQYWDDVAAQRKEALGGYFSDDAGIEWPCTGERFNVHDFILANCEYPGSWRGEVLHVLEAGTETVTVVRISSTESDYSCHVTSFFTFKDGKIQTLTEYYADDGPLPDWRQQLRLGDKSNGH